MEVARSAFNVSANTDYDKSQVTDFDGNKYLENGSKPLPARCAVRRNGPGLVRSQAAESSERPKTSPRRRVGTLAVPGQVILHDTATEKSRPSKVTGSSKDNADPLVTERGTLSENRLCTPTRLALTRRTEAFCVDGAVLNLPRNNPCCRYPIVVKGTLLEACIDSGATLCLLSREAYKRIKRSVGALQVTKRKASGAGGENLAIDGWVRFPFQIGASTYTYSFLVGDLSGIDCLLGLDWLQSVGAVIDFSTMKAEFGPKVQVQLSNEPLQINFCKVIQEQTLTAMSHTVVPCKSQYPVSSGYNSPVMFEPTCIRLGPGLTIASGVVCTDDEGCFNITIQNDSVLDYELQDDVLIGRLEDIEVDRKAGENTQVSQDRTPGRCVWHVNVHTPVRSLVIDTEHLLLTERHASPGMVGTKISCDRRSLSPDETMDGSTRDLPVTVILAPPRSNAKAELCRKTLREPLGTLKIHDVNGSMLLGTEGSTPEVQNRRTELKEPQRRVAGTGRCVLTDTKHDPPETPESLRGKVLVSEEIDTSSPDSRIEYRDPGVDPSRQYSPPPQGYHIYDTSGRRVLAGELEDLEYFDFSPKVEGNLTPRSSRVIQRIASGESPTCVRSTQFSSFDERSMEHLPQHLRCVMPPAGLLNSVQTKSLINLILEFSDVFVGPDGKVGHNTLLKHRIDTAESQPFKSHPRKKSAMEREHIAKEVQKLLEDGYIRPSMSPWGSAVVLARKKDGTLRFCIDYRELNKMTKKDAYPLPKIEECLDSLDGCQYYSTMDMAHGYWQVAMESSSIEKTAFTTHVGLFEWNVLPFGLCNAPATFCRLMELVLADILWKHCLVYLDDVISFGKTFEESLTSLREVLRRLQMNNLKLKAKKCEFFRTQVEYLGHEVGQRGIRPSLSKVQALHDWRIPTDVTGVKSFLGFTGFYRRYIKNYSELAKPLTELTKGPKGKRSVTIGKAETDAFNGLIAALQERVMLHHVIPGQPFYLTTDASNYAIGASLEQQDSKQVRVPIAFASKTLPDSRIHYCATKKELYAIVFFMRYFVGFYRGQQVFIETDHYALQWLWNFVDPVDSMYFRWITEMTNYEPWKVIYLPGKHNVVADALSRKNKPVPSESSKPHKDCRIEHCEICSYHFRKNKRCRDSDSPSDSSEEGSVSFCGLIELAITDPTDDGDLALWELQIIRSHEHPLVLEYYAQTRSQTKEQVERSRSTVPRRSERIAARSTDPPKAKAPKPPVLRRPRARVSSRPDGGGNLQSQGSDNEKQDDGNECVGNAMKNPIAGPPLTEVPNRDKQDGYISDAPATVSLPGSKSDIVGRDVVGRKQVSSSSLPNVLSESEDMGLLEHVLNKHSNEDWKLAQDNDLVISRVKALLSLHDKQPSPEDVKGESPTVQSMLLDWYSYEFEFGILCRRVLKLKHATCDAGTLQRVVPILWRRDLWCHMHGTECRHLSYEKVYDLLQRSYTWPGMSQDILDWGKACLTCQKTKQGIGRGLEPLKQDFTSHRNERVALDLVGILPCSTQENYWILVMQDYYTKWVELTALPNKQATTVAKAMVATWLCHWGCPESLHSDQGNEFDAEVFREVCALMGIHKTRTTPFNPSSNGMVERTNRTLKSMLQAMATNHYMTTWDAKLPLVMMAINNVIHRTTGFPPFRLQVAGNTDMRIPADLIYGKANPINYHCYHDFVFQLDLAMKEVHELVRLNMQRQMNFQRLARDKKPHKVRRYKIGDLCLRYYPPWASQKLHPFSYQGPYQVVDVDPDGLKVQLKNVPARGGRLQDTWIHVSALKPVLRTKCGKLLQMLDDGSWQVIEAPEQCADTASLVIPAIAGFTSPTGWDLIRLAQVAGVYLV